MCSCGLPHACIHRNANHELTLVPNPWTQAHSATALSFPFHYPIPLLLPHVDARAHDLIHQQQLAGDDGCALHNLLLHNVVVVHASQCGVKGLPGGGVQTHHVAALVLLLQLDDCLLGVMPRVLGQHLGEAKQGLGKCLNAQLGPPLHGLLDHSPQVVGGSYLKGASTWHHGPVLHHILHRPQTVTDAVLDLRNGVVVRPLDEDGAGARVAHLLHKRVLVLPEGVLVHQAGVAQSLRHQLLNRVDGHAATRQLQPLHVPPLGPAQRDDALLGQHVQGDGVDALHVDHHEALVRGVTHLAFQLNDLAHTLVSVLALRCHQLLPLLRTAVEEARVDLTLLVLE
mmetsp:Transcript_6793/g.15037  ORF Transcript_6793/g.15037 Transcript_6793/m.15037 type:complete len:341 (+) Transcript_6793:423-1445(+)